MNAGRGPATELVIFDCDGVLVDSETVGNQVLREVIAELGWTLTLEQTLGTFKGRSMADVWHRVETEVGRALPDTVYAEFRARQYRALQDVRPVAGILGLLAALDARGIGACVASNGPHEKMDVTLGATGLRERFAGRIFSRADVKHPKPHPDLFLHAAACLGVEPVHCMVVEDSPLGIEAARRAGMWAVGLAATSTADAGALSEAGAAQVLTTPEALLDLL